MFCGWRIAISYKEIANLGSGSLRIDCISAECHFNNEKIPKLSIAEEVQAWFLRDLADNNIPIDNIQSAELFAELELNVIDKKKLVTPAHFFNSGEYLKSDKFNQCKILCSSKIITETATYSGKYADIEEWPDAFIT